MRNKVIVEADFAVSLILRTAEDIIYMDLPQDVSDARITVEYEMVKIEFLKSGCEDLRDPSCISFAVILRLTEKAERILKGLGIKIDE